MALSTSYIEIAELLMTKLQNNSMALGLQGVFYGDQNLIPATPVVCVEPDGKDVTQITGFRKIDYDVNIFLLVYHGAIGSIQLNRQNTDLLAESIETLIHADKGLLRADGTASVIHCYITKIASGYVKKGNSTLRASRLTFLAKTQAQLPNT